MPDVTAKTYREDLLREIFGALREWSELERTVFARVHYRGQSPKAIAHSLKMDLEEVNAILSQCDRRLYASLREFRKTSCLKSSRIHGGTAAIAVRERDPKCRQRSSSKACQNPGIARMAI